MGLWGSATQMRVKNQGEMKIRNTHEEKVERKKSKQSGVFRHWKISLEAKTELFYTRNKL